MIKAMLAHEYVKHSHRIQDWDGIIIQPKFDGIRAIYHNGNLYSRNLKPIYVPHITTHLQSDTRLDGIYDGELIVPGEDFNGVASIVRRTVNPHPRSKEVKFVVFDILNDVQLPLWERFNEATHNFPIPAFNPDLRSFEQSILSFTSPVIASPEMGTAKTAKADGIVDCFAEGGWEGIMLKNPAGIYKAGKRSFDLLKYKKWQSEVISVIEVLEGQGKASGMMGKLRCVIPCHKTGINIDFYVGTGFSDSQRIWWWKWRNEIGRTYFPIIKIKYQELSKDGVPRFPVFVPTLD